MHTHDSMCTSLNLEGMKFTHSYNLCTIFTGHDFSPFVIKDIHVPDVPEF